jgi:hypothetical protein
METLRLLLIGSSAALSLASLLLAVIAYQNSRRVHQLSRRQNLTQLRIEVLKTYATAVGRMQAIVRNTSLALAEDTELSKAMSPPAPPHSLLVFLRNQLNEQNTDAKRLLSTLEDSLKKIESTWHGTSDEDIEKHAEKLFETLAGANRAAAIAAGASWDSLIHSFRSQLALKGVGRPANDA